MDRRRSQLEDGDAGSKQKHTHKYRQHQQHYYCEKHPSPDVKHLKALADATPAGGGTAAAAATAHPTTASSRATKPAAKTGPRRRRRPSTTTPPHFTRDFGGAAAAIAATATGTVAAAFAAPASHHTTPPPPPPAKQRSSTHNGSSWLTFLDSDALSVPDDYRLQNNPAPSDASSSRESLESIVDDPFFLRYDPAFSQSAQQADHPDLRPQAQTDSDVHTPNQHWPSPRRESLTVGSSLHSVRWSHHNPFPPPSSSSTSHCLILAPVGRNTTTSLL